jgi:hypothetical protein
MRFWHRYTLPLHEKLHSCLTLILLMWRIGWAPNSIQIYIQQDTTLHISFTSGNCSTCFGWYFHPSSGARTTVCTASGICHTVTAICRYRGRVGTGLSVLWDCGFESRRMHGCVSFVSVTCCQVKVSETAWSLVQRNPTNCGMSECEHEASLMRTTWPTRDSCSIGGGKRNSSKKTATAHMMKLSWHLSE